MNADELRERFPKASDDFIRRNASIPVATATQVPVKSRLRQNTKGLNKTEAAYFEVLKQAYPHCHVDSQSVTLLLGNGVRYTPDFTVAFYPVNQIQDLRAFETKGFMRDDASVKIKVAASRYPWIQFYLVTKENKKDGGNWHVQHIIP